MTKFGFLIVSILLISLPACAQEYVAEAPLSEVKANGFYSVTLPPNITASLRSDVSNIRILDSQNAEVPYIVVIEKPEYTNVEWIPIKIEKDLRRGCCTVITLLNPEQNYLDNFLLQVKNAEINKTGSLRGSDDGKTWYAVIENFQLTFGTFRTSEVSEVFDFPLSNYKYYQLTINDSKTSPLNVIGALRTKEDIIHGAFVEVPNVRITSADSLPDHETWGIIEFDTAQYVDRLEFDVAGPHLFKREATLLRKTGNRFETLESFDIISGQHRPLSVGLKEKRLFIRIENESNPPLRFTQVASYQFKRTLITYLDAGRSYRIALGNDNIERPSYDLGFFRDSIPSNPTQLEIGELKKTTAIRRELQSKTYFTNKNIVWVAIVVVAVVLAGMTMRMLQEKELKK